MEYDQIEAFINVVKYGTISAAARNVYMSQSYMSHKIKLLEEELGVPLLTRGKGTKSVELTSYGAEFLRLVQQYHSIWNDMLLIKDHMGVTNLAVGAVDSINSFIFGQLYIQHIQKHADIRLAVHTYHSRDLYGKVENRQIDLAYVYNAINYADILLTPLYHEAMYLVCRTDSPYHDEMDPAELPAEKEIYMRINSEYEIWHNQYWPDERYMIRITAGDMLSYLLTDPDCWAIAHISLINRLRKHENIKICSLKVKAPDIICYQIEHKHPRPSRAEAIRIFKQEVIEHITSLDYVTYIPPAGEAGDSLPDTGGKLRDNMVR